MSNFFRPLKIEVLIWKKNYEGNAFRYSANYIEEKLSNREYEADELSASGCLPLRYAVLYGRRDVAKVLMIHGARPLRSDSKGIVLNAVLNPDSEEQLKGGMLLQLVDMLQHCDSDELQMLCVEGKIKSPSRYAMKYIIERSNQFRYPEAKLRIIGLDKIDNIKYAIIGQSFALKLVLRDITHRFINPEDNKKPLVMLFAGTPGHGKTEMTKMIARYFDGRYLKIDCKNHATPTGMFGSDVGYMGSDSPSQLSSFVEKNHLGPNIVLLDEFDHCDAGTFDAFYQVFEEGEFTLKRSQRAGKIATSVVDCRNTVWILTTNRFDADIKSFNDRHLALISGFTGSETSFDFIERELGIFMRPKMQAFFKGGFSRRIDSVVPFFYFSQEEAYVVTAKALDAMCEKYKNPSKYIGDIDVFVSDFAIGEILKEYFENRDEGASSIKRAITKSVEKHLKDRWMKDEIGKKMHYHFDKESKRCFTTSLSEQELSVPPYFVPVAITDTVAIDVESVVAVVEEEQVECDDFVDPFMETSLKPIDTDGKIARSLLPAMLKAFQRGNLSA